MAIAVAFTGINNGASGGSLIPDNTQNEVIIDGTLTLTGSYGSASSHGDTVDFTKITSSVNIYGQTPIAVMVYEAPAAGVAALGYEYIFCPGTTQANGVLQILGTGAASGQGGTEITEGSAYSGFTPSLSGAVLKFRAWFARL